MTDRLQDCTQAWALRRGDRFATCNGNAVTISSTAAENTIPADLIINWNQTGVRMVPVNDWIRENYSRLQAGLRHWSIGDKRGTFSGMNVHFEIGLDLYSCFYTTKKSTIAKRVVQNDTNVQWVIEQLLGPTVAQSLIM